MRRLYLPVPLAVGHAFPLEAASYHYVMRVLRCQHGDTLVAFNGDGKDYIATLEVTGKKSARLAITGAKANANESPLKTILIQGLSKGERMDNAIQKAVELGVSEIYPAKTAYCAVKLTKEREQKKWAHWQGIITAACEQSERSVVPTLHPITPVTEIIHTIEADAKWLLHPYTVETDPAPKTNAVASVALLIGPEGGLSKAEVEQALESGFIGKQLGQRILRTETAAIAALSLCQQRWGDWHV